MIKKMSKIVLSVTIVLFLLGAVGVTAVQPSRAYAADIGVVDYQLVLSKHPDTQKVNQALQAEIDQAKKEFDAKSAGLSDKDKQDLNVQLGQRIEQKKRELLGPILDKINAAIKAVADSKGLQIVVNKAMVVYSGVDITNDVINKVNGG